MCAVCRITLNHFGPRRRSYSLRFLQFSVRNLREGNDAGLSKSFLLHKPTERRLREVLRWTGSYHNLLNCQFLLLLS